MVKQVTPPPSYAEPPFQAQTHPIAVRTATVTIFGPRPVHTTCPNCNAQITTEVKLENTTRTHLLAILLCIICFPCAIIPYCTDSCQGKNHYCPNCEAYLGSYTN